MNTLADASNNFKCRQVQANYDGWARDSVRPINATVFFYFFNADRAKRSMAQALLAAIRFPNERLRKAYMRYFAGVSYP